MKKPPYTPLLPANNKIASRKKPISNRQKKNGAVGRASIYVLRKNNDYEFQLI